MPQLTNCPQCQRKLNVPDSLLGKAVKCPSCGMTFRVGEPEYPTASLLDEPPPPSRPSRREIEASHGVSRQADVEVDEYEDEEFEEERPRRRRRRRWTQPHRGGTILALGIISLVACALCGPFAWVMGSHDLKEMEAGRMDRSGEGQTRAGYICGIISSVLMIAGLLFYCVIFIIMFAAGAAGGR